MTKYNKIKQILTVFRNENNDAKICISLDAYEKESQNDITFKIKCDFQSELLNDVDFRMFIVASKQYPSIVHMTVLDDMDYTIKTLKLNDFSNDCIETLINSLLDAKLWEIECKLNSDEIFSKN